MIALGMTDAVATPAQLADRGITWTRIITSANAQAPDVAQQIRDAHDAGLKVVLTVGGIGTDDRRPNFKRSIRFVQRLPSVAALTIDNEPDLDGVKACTYRRGWMMARRIFGGRLKLGDVSAARGLTFLQHVANCGRLPRSVDVAVHPYCASDPLAPCRDPNAQLGLGDLGYGKRWLKRNAGIDVKAWWATEFGYPTIIRGEPTGMTDARAAWLWPRAVERGENLGLSVLIAYNDHTSTWRTAPVAL
jgi:hypothetical protein